MHTPFPLFYTLTCTLLLPLDVVSWTLLYDPDMEAGLSSLTAFIRRTIITYNTVVCLTGPQVRHLDCFRFSVTT